MHDTETTRDDERILMEDLRTAHDRHDAKAVNRLITKVWGLHGDKMQSATRSFPDGEAAAWAALHQMTSRGGVRLYLAAWTEGLEAYAVVVAKQSRVVRDAGLLSRKIVRDDAAYSSRSSSLDAFIEAHGDRVRSARTLEQLEAEQRRETRAVREGFERISDTLTDKQRAAVLRYANLHVDTAEPKMASHEDAASSLRITRQSLDDRLDLAAQKVENDPAFRARLAAVCDVEPDRIDRAATENQEHRKAAAAAAAKRAAERAAAKRQAVAA